MGSGLEDKGTLSHEPSSLGAAILPRIPSDLGSVTSNLLL